MEPARSLTPSQLAFLDTMITRAQEKGRLAGDRLTPPNETVGLADAHHPLFDISEHDLRIIEQIQELSSQLQFSITLSDLIKMRERAVRTLAGR
jgi:hypothetical protein